MTHHLLHGGRHRQKHDSAAVQDDGGKLRGDRKRTIPNWMSAVEILMMIIYRIGEQQQLFVCVIGKVGVRMTKAAMHERGRADPCRGLH